MGEYSPFSLVGQEDGKWFYLDPRQCIRYTEARDTLKHLVNTNNDQVGNGQQTVSVRVERCEEMQPKDEVFNPASTSAECAAR